jgi:hypothetical protein
MKINNITIGIAALAFSFGALHADTIPFAVSNGGGIIVDQLGSPASAQTNLPAGINPIEASMMRMSFLPGWDGVFGNSGQNYLQLNTGGVVTYDGNQSAVVIDGTASNTWAIQNYQGGASILNSSLRGTIVSMSLTDMGNGDAQFNATLATDGFFHWYTDFNGNLDLTDDVTAIYHAWGTNILPVVYVSGLLHSDAPEVIDGGGYYHNNVPAYQLTFSFGVPDSGTTVMMIGMSFLGLGYIRRRIR